MRDRANNVPLHATAADLLMAERAGVDRGLAAYAIESGLVEGVREFLAMNKTLITTAIAVTACTGSSNYWRTYTPASGRSSAPKATVVQKATLAIVDAGYETETSDGNTGLVISKWFQGTGMTSDDNRFRLRVTVDDAGNYSVTAQCQEKASGPLSGGGWNDHCSSDDKRPQFVLDAVAKITAGLK